MSNLWWAGCLLLAAGCTSPLQERVVAYNGDGLHLFQQGDYRHAAESFRAALELSPEDLQLRFNLAQTHERLGEMGKAEKVYQECLTRDFNHADSRHALCVLMVRQGRRDEAKQMVEEWLAREPKCADAYALDGWLWHQAGDLPRAQSRLQQALQFDAGNTRAMTELATLYEEMSRPDRALALYERSLDSQPDQPEVLTRVNRLKSRQVSLPKLE